MENPINRDPKKRGTLEFDAGGNDQVKIRPQRAPILGILLTCTGVSLENADTTDSTDINDLSVAKLLKRLKVVFNGDAFIDYRGEDAFDHQHIFRSASGPLYTEPDNAQASSGFAASIYIPLMPQRVIGQAFRAMHWPGLAVPTSGFYVEAEFEDGVGGAQDSDEGTAALVGSSAGDTYSFSSDPDWTVSVVHNDIPEHKMIGVRRDQQGNVQRDGDGNIIALPKFPQYAPRIKTFQSEGISDGATPQDLATTIPGQDRVMMLTMREVVGTGPTASVEDLVESFTVAEDDDFLGPVDKVAYREDLYDSYEGVRRSIEGHDAPAGVTPIVFARDGKVGGMVRLSQFRDPNVEVDIGTAPSGSEGRLRFVKHSGVKIGGATTGSRVKATRARAARRKANG